ncbi:MAG: hypothetical protein AABW64_00915 [Nanoarchaeota archaeon]
MIRTIYDEAKKRLDSYRERDRSMHIPAQFVESIEKELLIPPTRYERIERKQGSNDPPGFIRVNSPGEGNYKEMRLRLGTVTLGIRRMEEERNLESLLLLYLGRVSSQINLSGRAQVHMQRNGVMALLQRDLVISSLYTSPDIGEYAFVSSWYSEESRIRPTYPKTEAEALAEMHKGWKLSGKKAEDYFDFTLLPLLVMFVKEVAESVASKA